VSSSSAAKTSRGPAAPPGSVFNRISSMPSRSASATSAALRSTTALRLAQRIGNLDAESNRRIRSSSPGKRDTGMAISNVYSRSNHGFE